ncbi:plasma kallikrein-like isoform X1 [Sander lucioperca]|uniref:Plasma kallikrein-like n=1 Tax=Sander lucioperca TaxID=283035 RepID=A0A8D0CV00_SANLU|nr:plasma kallikrein-like isoform X1 [Sander lucioperca]
MGTHLILVGLLSICSLSFGQDCNQQLLENVDFPGNDITSLFSPDVEHCQQLCTQHSSCNFFTFVRADWNKDDRNFFCLIKASPNGQPTVQAPLQGVTSGFSLKPCSQDLEPCLSKVYQNVDFFGADYRALFTADYEECQRACTQDPACQFFTFINEAFKTVDIRNKCHLKFSWPVPRTPKVVKKTGVTSGFSQIPRISQQSTVCQGKLFPNTDIPGNDIENIPAASPEHCQALCSAHSVCTYFSFASNDLKCYMKNNNNNIVTQAKEGVTSGLPARFCQLDNTWLQVVYENVAFPTSVIRSEPMDEADTCQRTCTQDAFCQFYTYTNDNFNDPKFPRRTCFLKRTITMPAPPKVAKLANVVSGFQLRNCNSKTTV